ncbi:MAG: diguanylate cyclase, partial [Gammaproteobacteria bacterium]
AMTTAERIRYVMANHVYEAGVTLSLGVAEMGEEDTLSDLIAKADEAMYRAKASGRNRVSK